MKKDNIVFLSLLFLSISVSLPAFLEIPTQTRIILLSFYILFLSSFTIAHGSKTLGKRNILVFIILSIGITFFMEFLGTHYGIIFGHYYYTEMLGPIILDVPLAIPLTWFNILYLSYVISQILLLNFGRPQPKSQDIILHEKSFSAVSNDILTNSLLVGFCMVSWDFLNDPFMVNLGMWVWTQPSEFFNLVLFDIPVSNFIGWFITSVLVIVVFEMYIFMTVRVSEMPLKHNTEKNFYLVLIPYIYLVVFQALNGVSTGILSLRQITDWGPIVLSWLNVSIISVFILLAYTKDHKKHSFE